MEAISWNLGNMIRSARMKKGFIQDVCAEQLEISTNHLQQIEGGRRNPSVPLLFKMMKLLDFSVDALVFPERENVRTIHADVLTEEQAAALQRFLDTLGTVNK